MSLVLLLVGLAVTFVNLLIGILFTVVAIIISIVQIKAYKSIGKFVLVLSIMTLLFQSYLVIKRNGEFNGAKLKNAKTTINYLKQSAELYYMNYYYLYGENPTSNIVFACDGKKCFHGTDKLDTVGTIPYSGLIIISSSSNGSFSVIGKDIIVFDYLCNLAETGEIDCIQK